MAKTMRNIQKSRQQAMTVFAGLWPREPRRIRLKGLWLPNSICRLYSRQNARRQEALKSGQMKRQLARYEAREAKLYGWSNGLEGYR